jgi:hypothetical protein
MLLTQKLHRRPYKLLLLNAGAFVAATAFPAHAQGVIGDAATSSDKYLKNISGGAGAGSFDANKVVWGLIGFMLIVFVAIVVWFATADGMGGQQTWKDNLFKILGAAAPIVVSIIIGAGIIKWISG